MSSFRRVDSSGSLMPSNRIDSYGSAVPLSSQRVNSYGSVV